LHDVLSNNDADDPSIVAARKLDWQEFIADLPVRERVVVQFLIEGASGSAIARKLKTTDSRIQTIKRHLAKAIVEFMARRYCRRFRSCLPGRTASWRLGKEWPVNTNAVGIERLN
jgi:hypothetical protein